MVRHLRSNIVAYLALFVALGGTSYAARGVLLPANSVGSAQVIDHSLRRQDFRQGTLLRGARGPQGARGPKGADGVDGSNASLNGAQAGGDLRGTFPNPKIGVYAVTGETIAPGAVSAYHTAPGMAWAEVTDARYPWLGLLNGWHAAGGSWPLPALYFDFFGDLHLRGSIAGGTISDSANGAAFWFCAGEVPAPQAAFSVPTETAGGTYVPGEIEILQRPGPPPGHVCGVSSAPPPQQFVYEVRVVAGSNARVSLDGVSLWFNGYARTD